MFPSNQSASSRYLRRPVVLLALLSISILPSSSAWAFGMNSVLVAQASIAMCYIQGSATNPSCVGIVPESTIGESGAAQNLSSVSGIDTSVAPDGPEAGDAAPIELAP